MKVNDEIATDNLHGGAVGLSRVTDLQEGVVLLGLWGKVDSLQ